MLPKDHQIAVEMRAAVKEAPKAFLFEGIVLAVLDWRR
jgi:hypothetical protein